MQHAHTAFKGACELLDEEKLSTPRDEWIAKLERMHGGNIDKVLDALGISLTGDTYARLLIAVQRESRQASDVVLRQANGDWSPDVNLTRFPNMEIVAQPIPEQRFDSVWKEWLSSGTKFETDMRGFKPHEAKIILRATLQAPSSKVSPAFAAARRWVPWICAYSGARVNEITQARACDFSVVDSMTILHIRADAGTAKTGDRDVPLHEHIIEQGFRTFLASKRGDEPLFYAPRGKGRSTIPPFEEMGGRLGKWVRRLGISDKRLDPNHAWRHRFKGYSAKSGNDERVTDALQGHAPSTQGRRYGEVDLEERIEAVRKLARIEIPESPEVRSLS